MPKGIDDCKESFGEGFLDFWQKITSSAVDVPPKVSPDALAVQLAIRELPAINDHTNRAELRTRLTELASYLDPLHRDDLGKAAVEHVGVSILAFRDTAELIESRRREQDREKAARIVNDSRRKIELPGPNRLLSEFEADLAPLLARHDFVVKDGVVIVSNESGNCLDPVNGRAFRTAIERHVVPYCAVSGEERNKPKRRPHAREGGRRELACLSSVCRIATPHYCDK